MSLDKIQLKIVLRCFFSNNVASDSNFLVQKIIVALKITKHATRRLVRLCYLPSEDVGLDANEHLQK